MKKPLTKIIKGKTVEVGFDHNVRVALDKFSEALEAKKLDDKAKEEAEEVLRLALGDAEFATISGQKAFKMMQVIMDRPDLKKLQEEFPEVYKAVAVDGSYEFIRAIN